MNNNNNNMNNMNNDNSTVNVLYQTETKFCYERYYLITDTTNDNITNTNDIINVNFIVNDETIKKCLESIENNDDENNDNKNNDNIKKEVIQNNDRYITNKYELLLPITCIQKEIINANDYEKNKFGSKVQKRMLIHESHETYLEKMSKINFNIPWIQNILNYKSETENILCDTQDILIIKDLKCNIPMNNIHNFVNELKKDKLNNINNNKEFIKEFPNFYAIAIFKNDHLLTHSLRSLTKEDVPILQRVQQEIIDYYKYTFQVNKEYIRIFFHYPPSFYHLHLHITLTTSEFIYSVDHCYLLDTVIKNLQMNSLYYAQDDMIISKII